MAEPASAFSMAKPAFGASISREAGEATGDGKEETVFIF
jgi:hypothetical protein